MGYMLNGLLYGKGSLPVLTTSERVGLAMEMPCAELSGNDTQGSDDAKHPFTCGLHLRYTIQSRDAH